MPHKNPVSFEVSFTSAKDVGCSEILDNFLYLGSGKDASNVALLKKLGITHVLCMVNGWSPQAKWGEASFNLLHLPVLDKQTARIFHLFPKAIAFIDEAKANNAKVLVHCAAGISRSSTIVIAYLMQSNNMNLKKAYEYVYAKRYTIRPNPGFFSQLIEFDIQLYSQASMSPKDLPLLLRLRGSHCVTNKVLTPTEGMAWATKVVTDDLLEKLFLEVCGGQYVAEKTSDFLDKVMTEVKELPAVAEMQQNGYKWPKLSLNVVKTASYWYRAQKPISTTLDTSFSTN